MNLLLMVEREGRVVCEGTWTPGLREWAEKVSARRALIGGLRFWLVEAESAEMASACIALWKRSDGIRTTFNDDMFVDAGTVEVRVRILASGGKP